MSKNLNGTSLDSNRNLNEHEERAIARCFNMVDYISDAAANMILGLIQTNPCPEAKRFLLARPEELAIKSFEKVIYDIVHGGRPPEERPH